MNGYRPETRARALLRLTTDLAARARAPSAYGDIDIDPDCARLLRALTVVERIAARAPIAYDRHKALDAFQALAQIDALAASGECAMVDRKERRAMALASVMAQPVQGPSLPVSIGRGPGC